MASDFVRATRQEPCPVCHGETWCWRSRSTDLIGCMRATEGGLERQDKQGGTYRLFGTESEQFKDRPKERKPEPPRAERASDEDCDAVYLTMLNMLGLSDDHHDDLEARGLDPQKMMCRTWVGATRFNVLNEMREIFGLDVLMKVPGFHMKENAAGKSYLDFSCFDDSMMIPVLNKQGQIVSIKSRVKDEVAAQIGQRYVYSSSTKYGGPSSGTPVYVPLSVSHESVMSSGGALRITEGELKAEVATKYSIPTIGVPGVNTWGSAIAVIKEFDPRIVVVAYDSDSEENEHVARAKNQLIDWCLENGYLVHDEKWTLAKGVDDALVLEIPTTWTPFEREYRKLCKYLRSKKPQPVCHDNDSCRWLWEQVLPRVSKDTVNPITLYESFLRRLHKDERTPRIA